jgi:hypothetical protein
MIRNIKNKKISEIKITGFWLFISRFFTCNRHMVSIIIDVFYASWIKEINEKYKQYSHEISLEDTKKSIIDTYFSTPFFGRPYISDLIIITRDVKNIFPITKEKKQGRNELCNCGSGKKYKHCGLLNKCITKN